MAATLVNSGPSRLQEPCQGSQVVQILNVNGQLVQEELYHDLNGEQTLNINTSQIQVRGTYIVRLISDNGIVIRRIVK